MATGKESDIRPVGAQLYFLPVKSRVPLKFGSETLTHITCARVRLTVEDREGNRAVGWGETPLSVQWVWPSTLSYEDRHAALKGFTIRLVEAWAGFDVFGHPLEVGYAFIEKELPRLRTEFNHERGGKEDLSYLASLVCCSPFDLALHDAYGVLHGVPVYRTYSRCFLNGDLSRFLEPEPETGIRFEGRYPVDFIEEDPPVRLPVWHLVGGVDPLDEEDLSGTEPRDGFPVLLRDWIRKDGLRSLKIKLRGNDADWDHRRILRVGNVAVQEGVDWLSADFNCTVKNPDYVNDILDRLMRESPRIYGMLLYVEQPFPYDLESHRIDVHSVSARKPLFMDESAHDWRLVRFGRRLGWSGVALKTCKTQTGALLSLCWAKAHGMTLMVQDLSNPMIAQIPHLLLAAHAGTIHGVESNAMQFWPDASRPEAEVHPGLYTRREGSLDLASIRGSGFGYRIDEIERELPPPAAVCET